MGWQIALTGLVVFAFGVLMFTSSQKHKRQPLVTLWAYITLIGLAAIPIGLIIQIWR